ncbi:MAG: manganese efflux pump [Oscillospiraceae bacterium]|nr:manganese efflux pump [Oscillospiraceae bacterium]
MLSVLLIGISLSMDAFAVTVTNAVALRPFRSRDALWMALYFGAFQALMPLAGALLGSTVAGHIMAVGPYISFILLAVIGIRMIHEALAKDGEEEALASLTHSRLVALAVATSIDALAVGVSFAFTPPAPGIWLSCAVIGLTTFCLTLLAGLLAGRIRLAHPRRAGILGGLVLLFLGFKVLLAGIL